MNNTVNDKIKDTRKGHPGSNAYRPSDLHAFGPVTPQVPSCRTDHVSFRACVCLSGKPVLSLDGGSQMLASYSKVWYVRKSYWENQFNLPILTKSN